MKKVAALMATAMIVVASCSQGEGNGTIFGTLNVPDCWTGSFNLGADFFAAAPYRNALEIRIQNGGDYEGFSDGLSFEIYDITKIRPDPTTAFAGLYGQPMEVALPPEVTPPGVPVIADPNPANVSIALYLQKTCQTQTVALYAVKEVTVPADGTCDAPEVVGADPTNGCDGTKTSPAGVGSGKSMVTFNHVFNGNVDEPTAAQRLTDGCFDIYLADPRDEAPGGLGPPPRCLGHLKGSFSFFFERGRPSQPFP